MEPEEGTRIPVNILMVVDFPGPVGPDVTHHFTGIHGERDVVDRPYLPGAPPEEVLNASPDALLAVVGLEPLRHSADFDDRHFQLTFSGNAARLRRPASRNEPGSI